MPINPQIALSYRSPDIQPFDPVADTQQKLTLKQLMLQSKAAQDSYDEDQAVRDAYKQSGGDVTRLRDLLTQGGHYKAVQSFDKADLENKKIKAELGAKSAETAAKKIAIYRDMLANVNSPEDAAQWLTMQHNDPDLAFTPLGQADLQTSLSRIPQDPAQFQQWKQQNALGMTKYLELNKPSYQKLDSGGSESVVAIPGLGGPAQTVTSVTKTASPDALLSAETARRGQNMTDARARERLSFEQGNSVADAGGPSQIGLTKKFGKAPPGWRWKEDGSQEPIPGGPADEKAKAKQAGYDDVSQSIAVLRNAYDRLESGGGITSTNNGAISNAGAAVASSGIGQVFGRAFGTNNQSARNDIAMARPALLASLMKATGMSARQIDSNAELKLWLATATDPTLDVESNRRALDNIERKYLNAQPPKSPAPQASAPKLGEVRKGYVYMGGDPSNPASWKKQ